MISRDLMRFLNKRMAASMAHRQSGQPGFCLRRYGLPAFDGSIQLASRFGLLLPRK
jgi:hypothetical protein